ncbi:MAG: FecR domain-containing protein [Campylobacterales bacterium]|nr:FecR domain-containing protein [Campylobacterales bacterium]
MRFFLIFVISLFFTTNSLSYVTGFTKVGKMVKTKGKGKVTISRKWGARYVQGGKNKDLFTEDGVSTDKNSKAYLKLHNGSKLIVAKGSKLKIIDQSRIHQKGGNTTYDIKKRKKKLKIITDFANINIKGTKFDVADFKNTKVIALHEGSLDIDFKGEIKTLFEVDPNCGEEPKIDQRATEVSITEGEVLTFEGRNIYKTCYKNHQPLEDTVTLIYKNGKRSHSCMSMYGDFNSNETPKILAIEEGCFYYSNTEYQNCEKTISFNTKPDKPKIEDGILKLLLSPQLRNHHALFQYKCQ